MVDRLSSSYRNNGLSPGRKAKVLLLVQSTSLSVHLGIPNQQVLATVKAYSSNRTDELVSKTEGMQAKANVSFFHALLCGLTPESMAQILGAASHLK